MKIDDIPANKKSLKKTSKPKKPSVYDGLDPYEQEIEDTMEQTRLVPNQEALKRKLVTAAKVYLSKKKPITLRLSVHDIAVMKLKASKLGVPYQTYINMVIHRDTQSL